MTRPPHSVITGAASGIGRATALQLAAAGHILYLTDIQTEALQQLTSQLQQQGAVVALSRRVDLCDRQAVADFCQHVLEACGAPDQIYNIAGISIWGQVQDLSLDDWQRCIDINLMGPIQLIHHLVPAMIVHQRGGKLVNVSSAAGLFGLPWHAAYSASKFGLVGISEVLRFDLKRHGIQVSVVCPGAVHTGLVQTLVVRGVDSTDPKVQQVRQRFTRHALSAEQAATAMIRAVEQGQELIFLSRDIQLLHWTQQKFAPAYRLTMRALNAYLHRVSRS